MTADENDVGEREGGRERTRGEEDKRAKGREERRG